jgi:hypothetical protein
VSDRSTLTTAEIDAVFKATVKERLKNGKNKIIALDRYNTPTLNWLRKNAKTTRPVRGDYVVQVEGERAKTLQTWSGTDFLNYESADTVFELTFGAGKVHLGDKLVHDQLEQAGLDVDYSAAAKGKLRAELPSDVEEVVYDLAKKKLDALENNYLVELNKMVWRDNSSDPKAWPGIDALIPVTGSTVGLVGGKPRTDPLLQHVVKASVAAADLESEIDDLVYQVNKKNGQDGSRADFAVCGRAFIKTLKAVFMGNATLAQKMTRNVDLGEMQKRIGIGLPDDAMYIEGLGVLVPDPVFEELDAADNPAIPWTKRLYVFNSTHFQMQITRGMDGLQVVKPTPYNQQITYVSIYGQYAIVDEKPNGMGCLYLV